MAVMLCETCLTEDTPARRSPGSFWVELVLWLLFCVPGLVYTVWRMTAKYDACRHCEGRGLLPINSPRAQMLLAEAERYEAEEDEG